MTSSGKNEGGLVREKNPIAVALGQIGSDKKKISSPKNSLGNKSKLGQKASEETKALLRQRWAERKDRAAKEKAAASIAAAGTGNGETESTG